MWAAPINIWWIHIKGHRNLLLMLTTLLSVGLSAILLVLALQAAFQTHVLSEAKELLSSDLRVSSRRAFTDSEKQIIETLLKKENALSVQTTSIYSMLAHGERSRLVEVIAVEEGYPFYGKITAKSGAEFQIEALRHNPQIWIYSEILSQLQLKVGDFVQLGQSQLEVAEIVDQDVGVGMVGTSFAPRIYLHRKQLQKTELVQFGSTYWSNLYIKTNSHAQTIEMSDALDQMLDDPGVEVRTYVGNAESANRPVQYLLDFLGLVALGALLLSLFGFFYFFTSYLKRDIVHWPIWLGLGLRPIQLQGMVVLTTSLIGVVSALASCVVVWFLIKGLPNVLPQGMQALKVEFSLQLFAGVIGLAWIVSLLSVFPVLLKASQAPRRLVTEERVDISWRLRDSLLFLPCLTLFYFLAVYLCQSYFVAGLFLGVFVCGGFVMGMMFLVVLKTLEKAFASRWVAGFLAVSSLSRRPYSALVAFLAFSLALCLMLFIPKLSQALQSELQVSNTFKLPALFLFDVQEEQRPPLLDFLKSKEAEVRRVSPLIRARLLKINGEDFIKRKNHGMVTREQQRADRIKKRGLNLSYREGLDGSEKIVRGKPFDVYKADQPKVQLSIEMRYADRLELKIGDELTFDIQGMEVLGVVHNLRKVNWLSFEPNFFILVQPGFLEEAPKTHVITISQPAMPAAQLENELVNEFPNISVIHVRRLVKELLKLTGQMTLALQVMSWFCLIGGLMVLAAVFLLQSLERAKELSLLKNLGGSVSQLRLLQYLPPIFLTGFSAVLAFCMAYGSVELFLQLVFKIS